MRTRLPFALLASAFACSLFAAPAQALRARVFVSKAGADVGACSFSAPCQSLDYALNGVEPNGEITILDSAGYNPITITKGVTITVPPGVEASIGASANAAAITINAGSSDVVSLHGLTLNGAGVGADGVIFNAGGTLEVIDCAVSNYANNGIYVSTSADMSLVVLNTVISNISQTASSGIYLNVTEPSTITATLDHITFSNNTFGISMYGTDGNINAMISNTQFASSVHSGNLVQFGIWAQGTQNVGEVTMTLKNVTLSNPGAVNISLLGYTTTYLLPSRTGTNHTRLRTIPS